MNYVASSAANGSIGYVEYSYALAELPGRQDAQQAGYFTLPTQYNVAVALETAQINMDKSSPDYLLQNLNNVYTDPDPRTYPLSSYVYMIEPTGKYPTPGPKITTAQAADDRRLPVLLDLPGPAGDRSDRLLAAAGQPGRSRLRAARQAQEGRPGVDLTNRNIITCNNPTFVQGQPEHQLPGQIAPQPPACDKIGAGPCAAGVTPNGIGPTPTSSAATGNSGGEPRARRLASGGTAAATGGDGSGGQPRRPADGAAAASQRPSTAGRDRRRRRHRPGSGASGAATAPAVRRSTTPPSSPGYALGRARPGIVAPLAVLLLAARVHPAVRSARPAVRKRRRDRA